MKIFNKNQITLVICLAVLLSLDTTSVFGQSSIRDIVKRNIPVKSETKKSENQKQTQTQSQTGDQDTMRRNFINEFGKYRQSVYYLMELHDPKLKVGNTTYGPPVSEDVWIVTMKELGEIDEACKSKYKGMTDSPDRISWGELNQLPATWCAIAANRFEYEKKGKVSAAFRESRNITDQITRELNTVEREPEERITLSIQNMFWETEKWKAEMFVKLKPKFDELKVEIPNDLLDEFITRGNSIREKREASGANRSFKMPPNKDVAIETWVRQQILKGYPQAQILKIGSEYATWKVFTNRVNIPTARTKRGWYLVKLPNRPLCQAREWIVKQDYAGGGKYSANKVDSLGHTGILMKCQ